MFYAGSRVSVIPGALRSTAEYDNARADVLHYNEAKDRFAVHFIHPSFAGKELLLRGAALDFHLALLPEHLRDAKSELVRRRIAFESRSGFAESTGPSGGSGFGKALVATASFATGDLVLEDAPFLVVSNPSSLDRWVRRWDCFYEVMKRRHGGVDSDGVMQAFEEMDHGGPEVIESLKADAEATLELIWAAAGEKALRPPAEARNFEALRIATVFARWQTNQHELAGGAGSHPRRGLYWLAPKVAHSCNPNVGWEDPDTAGRVELRALRSVAEGDVLGVNYMDAQFLTLPVQERRRRLLSERKFRCVCTRCAEDEGAPVPWVELPTTNAKQLMRSESSPQTSALVLIAEVSNADLDSMD